ncbi:uncharacterized protein TNCT_360141 [Trichonephila clavata]|uniref:Uncharacterized protein n=1 Tax=Trichonephila clavata TaxID=2740835 RepID=A0A8X6F4F3_TRICU|nr:uncharacterized protein TNCT_360141 [Trichonephila clavata]
MKKRINAIEKSFMPVLLLLHFTGLESYPNGGILKQTGFHHFMWESPKYLFRFLQFLAIITEAMALVLLPEKKKPIALFVLVLLQLTVNLQTRRSSKQIRIIMMKLWKCTQMLQCDQNGRKFQTSIFAYCFVIIVMFICFVLLYRFSDEFEMYRSLIENSAHNFPKLKQFIMLIPEVSVISIPTVVALVFIPLTGYYGFVCFYVKFLFNRIEEKIGHLSKDCPYVLLIQSYLELISIIKSLDDYLSFSAFVVVLSAMFGLFFINFNIIFLSDGYLHAFFGETGIFVPVCLVILSASAANQAFFTAKEALQSLPWKIPQYRDKLKEMIRSECMRSASLTLWKVYKIERSLIFSAMGTLVTYGMLLATLGGMK